MLLIYITKPDVVYDNEKNEFRQFGTTDGKTLLPIYVIGILLAIILYVFFHYLSQQYKPLKSDEINRKIKHSHEKVEKKSHIIKNVDDEYNYYLQQQIQLQNIQNQLNQLVQQQMTSQQLNQNIIKYNPVLPNELNV